jgi:putative transposase
VSAVYAFVAVEKASYPVALMCRVLEVNRTAFYAWTQRTPSERETANVALTERIVEIHAENLKAYGSRRIHAELRFADNLRVGLTRVERLMREAKISGLVKRRRGRTTISVPGVRTAADLVERDFNPQAPDRLWTADITYIRTWEGWLYLASIIDCYSRRIVGWSMADHLRHELVVDALNMAVDRRRPGRGLIHHSDQGSQFTALVFGQRCRLAGINVSMGSKGDCFDNAVCESFHASIKKELLHRHSWPTKAEARTAVFDYIETFYNQRRRHSTLGYIAPALYEAQYEETMSNNDKEEQQAA